MSQRFESEQWLPAPLAAVFAFFADPRNLPRIIPPSRGARILKLNLVLPRFPVGELPPGAEHMASVGTEIVLKFRAIPCIPLHEKWTAVITDFELNQVFRDIQKQGPFRRWEHTHTFASKTVDCREGTLVHDSVEYEVGFGMIGSLLERMIFQRIMRSTFDYRRRALEAIYQSR